MEKILEVKNLSFEYSDASVLRDVSFAVQKGDFLGIIGPNGAGKSTLIKLILGLLPYKDGEILLHGTDIRARKPDVGYVSQRASSFNTGFPATVREVVTSGLKKPPFKRLTERDVKRVDECIAGVGMTEYADKLIGRLSGGQQQKTFIARALAGGSDVLILDEPTVGIDAMSVKEIMSLISGINKRGTTIIMTSHDTPVLIEAANRLLVFCEHGNAECVEKSKLSIAEISELYAGKRRHYHD